MPERGRAARTCGQLGRGKSVLLYRCAVIRVRTAPPFLAILMAGVLVGCSAVPLSSATSTPEPDVTTPERSRAELAYRSYIDASNSVVLGDPATFASPGEFTSDRFHADEHAAWSRMHREGNVAGGAIAIESFGRERLSADGTVVATACNDVSALTLVDAGGESLLPADAPDALEMRLEFTRIDGELLLSSSVVTASGAECPVSR